MKTIFYHNHTSSKAFINPEDAVKSIADFPEVCISTFSKPIIDKFASMPQTETIAALYTANGTTPVYKIHYGGKAFAFYQSLVGAPACVCGMEEIIAMGGKKFIFFGCCGVLDNDKVRDKLIVPTSAIRDEGTSYHYIAPSDELKPDKEMTKLLEQALETCGYSYVSGKIWTTDAIYRETIDGIHERKSEGCIAVEMEYSALLAVSNYRNVPFLQFFYGADNLDSSKWQPRDLTDYGLNGSEKYMALALECGLRM